MHYSPFHQFSGHMNCSVELNILFVEETYAGIIIMIRGQGKIWEVREKSGKNILGTWWERWIMRDRDIERDRKRESNR